MRKLPKPHSHKISRTLHRWHRRIGLTSAFFVILLVLTGIPLHHADDWGLQSTFVSSDWLLDGYGIEAPSNYRHFKTPQFTVTEVEDSIYIDQTQLPKFSLPLVGAIELNDFIIIASQKELLIVSQEKEVVDQLSSVHGLPTPILALAQQENSVVLKTPNGYFQTNDEISEFQSIQFIREPDFVLETPIDQKLWNALQNDIRHQTISWERVLLDLHSGRLFGPLGPWIMDIAGILFLLMAFTGIWIWTRKKPQRR